VARRGIADRNGFSVGFFIFDDHVELIAGVEVALKVRER